MPDQSRGEVRVAFVMHKHGSNIYAAATEPSLTAQVAGFCRDWWAQESANNPSLSPVAPESDSATVEQYFETVAGELLEYDSLVLEPIADPTGLGDQALADAYERLNDLTREISRQRAALAREQIKRIRSTAAAAGPHEADAGERSGQLSAEACQQLYRLLRHVAASEAEQDSVPSPLPGSGTPAAHDPGQTAAGDAAIAEQIARELPRRSSQRHVRWTVAQLERIRALAEAARDELQQRDPDTAVDTREAIVLLAGIAETATRLSAARRSPHGLDGADSATIVQVAYLVGVEDLVDLDERRVTRVVIIDESLELDVEEGARAEGTLTSLTSQQAADALAVAERPDQEQPPMEFGF